MKEKKVMKIIDREVKSGRENNDSGDVILERIKKQVSDTNQLEYCLKMYMFVQETYETMVDIYNTPSHFWIYENDYSNNYTDFLGNDYSWGIKDYKKFLKYLAKQCLANGYDWIGIVQDSDNIWFFLDSEFWKDVELIKRSDKYFAANYFPELVDLLEPFDKVYRGYKNHTLDVEEMTIKEFEILQAIKGCSFNYDVNIGILLGLYEVIDIHDWLDAFDIKKVKEINDRNFVTPDYSQGFNISDKSELAEFCNVF